MAIKVLGYDEDIAKKVTCFECGAILQYNKIDVLYKITSDYTGCKEQEKYIICPVCNQHRILP